MCQQRTRWHCITASLPIIGCSLQQVWSRSVIKRKEAVLPSPRLLQWYISRGSSNVLSPSVLQRHQDSPHRPTTTTTRNARRVAGSVTFPNTLTLLNNIHAPARFTPCNGIPGKTGGAAGQGGQSGTQRNTRRRINSPPWPRRQVSNTRSEEYDLPPQVQTNAGAACTKFSYNCNQKKRLFWTRYQLPSFLHSGIYSGMLLWQF